MLTILIVVATVISGAQGESGPQRTTTPAAHSRDALLQAVRDHDALAFATRLQSAGVQKGDSGLWELEALMGAAIERNDVAIVRLLLDHGADPNAGVGRQRESPLLAAARLGCWEIADLLLASGAAPNGRGAVNNAFTPLYVAALHDNLRVAYSLLSAGADPNTASRIGRDGRLLNEAKGPTPLMEALRRGDLTLAEALLKHGAKPHVTDESGRRPIDYLEEHQSAIGRLRLALEPQRPRR
jgi:ankyrin repeat protein